MTVLLTREPDGFREACERVRASGRRLGVVPTMGALHAGHLALVEEANRHADEVALTIFVNPTQFGPGEDLAAYPRTLDRDLEACDRHGVTLLFAPSAASMYPEGERTRVAVSHLTTALCGASRPGHFEGVATIVAKLLVLAGPCVAVFGRKDYQQLKVIERLVRDLMLPARVVGHPIVREPDGLAVSSRNTYLDAAWRKRALGVPTALATAASRFARGERSVAAIRGSALEVLQDAELRVDYVTVADPEEIRPLPDDEAIGDRALLAVAVFAGTTRLIDNVVLGEDPGPPMTKSSP